MTEDRRQKMRRNYKLQNTNYKQITNYNVQNYKGNGVFEVDEVSNQLIINPKGGHGLHKDSFRLQTMTALNKKFLRGVQGGSFFKKRPPGRRRQEDEERPPVLGSWRNLYLLVLGNLLFWIALFTIFTWMFK